MKKLSLLQYSFVILIGSFTVSVISCINSNEYKKMKLEFRDVEYSGDFESFDSIYKYLPDYKEISIGISSLHTVFNKDILLPYKSVGLYNNSKKTAVAIGMYIADLGYVRYFERVQLCVDYLEAVSTLSQKLAVGSKEFNNVVPKIEENLNNKNELFELTDSLLNAGNVLLSDNEKYGISAMILGGFWIETTYIGLDYSKTINQETINKKIVLHFRILEQINKLFNCLSDESIISEFKNDLKEIETKGPENQNLIEDIIVIRNKFLM